ncbi:PAS domain S-box protein [Thalassospiraceae bacterium LMO-JJ14]|nr:PAS domain S-box protein [Thalassospiraceae bacterium LMO-JJ14]
MTSDNISAELAKSAAEAVRLADVLQANFRTSEARYRRLFETALDGILLLNFDTGQIEDVNPFLIKMLGYSHEEFLGKKLWEVGAFKDLPESKVMFLKLQDEGRVRYEDMPLKTKSGVVIAVEFISNSYDCEGTKVIQCNIRDIRERKLAEGAAIGHLEEIKLALLSTVEVAIEISNLRDPHTVGHEKNVAIIAVAIGRELGLDENRLEGLEIAGSLHDIGKISIPLEILSRSGKISLLEFQLVKGHPKAGYDILIKMNWPWPLAEAAYQHHERMDGSGYPRGLKGDEIILEAKIIAVADVVEAMTSHRPYRAGLGIEKALAEIVDGRRTKYDADVVDACLCLFREKSFSFEVSDPLAVNAVH